MRVEIGVHKPGRAPDLWRYYIQRLADGEVSYWGPDGWTDCRSLQLFPTEEEAERAVRFITG